MATSKAKTQSSQEKMEDAYQLAGEAASETVDSLKMQAKEKLGEGTDKVKKVTSQTESIIKERPLLSVGCAFIAGWAVSKLLK
ncbi:hypothetical protein ACR30L_19195 [Psychromonas sp. PT13]|uniref:hypothetical protein n=1 Tax=Psychromonas sp. PT13 TaxID=3439547 RepID=UPI003EBF106F